MLDLHLQRCQSSAGRAGTPALDPVQARDLLAQLAEWAMTADAIEKTFAFADFDQTMAFVNEVADIARTEDHHPAMHVGYRHCLLRFSTHDVGGLTLNDFICAAKVDALIP